MGNSGSQNNIVSGLNRSQNLPLYKLVDQMGGGQLVTWTKHGMRTGDFAILDGFLEYEVKKFLIKNGNGKPIPIADLVKRRNQERNAMLGALRRKKGKGKSGPNILDNFNDDSKVGIKVLNFFDGQKDGGSKYREIYWDINSRGGMGETLLHVCLLQGTATHNLLAKRLLSFYPKLVNDIFISEDYYGNSALHQAIVNEDPEMVRILLTKGADYHQRVYGAFFCPDDQRSGRTDSLEHEWVDLPERTDYSGRTYWGEYPLSFAACTQQEDCFRLLRAYKADINLQDTNGNTVLHMLVIHELPVSAVAKMFDLAVKLGAKLHRTNRRKLTPLTLAAKLAKAEMFQHILTIEREIVWEYGDVVSAAYPLNYIDTIDQETGLLNANSALAHIVYGDSNDHLNLLDGLMEDLLNDKWEAFGKRELTRRFFQFIVYWCLVFTAYITRNFGEFESAKTADMWPAFMYESPANGTLNPRCFLLEMTHCDIVYPNRNGSAELTQAYEQCRTTEWVRVGSELTVLLGVFVQMIQQALLLYRIGRDNYLRTLMAFPALCTYCLSFLVVIAMVPVRLMCWYKLEHGMATLVVLATTIHFLFYCRGIRFVGPFVLMIYRIILGDFLRFFLIYVIFVMGFSQSFYIIFTACDRGKNATELGDVSARSRMTSPWEAILRMFIMSIGEFAVFYKELNECRLANVGKVLFIIFELLVSIMLINLLIAMMARTYEAIVTTALEWKRQWAKTILMLEQWLPPRERLQAMLKYSRPLSANKHQRVFVVRWRRSRDEHEEHKRAREQRLEEYREERRQLLKRRMHGEISVVHSRSASKIDYLSQQLREGADIPGAVNNH